ncbi:undecaprenyldiphospho-muramoylpentapeptide beta-N-acetylglucosaminyltransferase [Actinotalea sp. BY-33]|uniref:UDP-N-acetylglucosamine--N-acetylmuramyl-(pentapeptide) pyrophosphoryl-undecaprenol N-acetylglucosamine transferase n=1 Tax=Actinotalea soli TaxID=2819234 RepID=A0A939RT28_9CELL|nr:undecaprenyldiphospho-muramoylpentapeptide beta-N-acetylglucosaminyltransferase [Actinotalea soli]
MLAGGGTAGHVNPLLAVADELSARHPGALLTVLGTAEGLEAELVPERGYPLVVVPKVPLPRRPTPDWLRLPGRLREAVDAAEHALEETEAQVVVGFGGYVSTPAYLAARRRGTPVVIHEQNARPGLANRLGARWASSVAVTFPGTQLAGAQVTGLPLRPEIADLIDERAVDAAGTRVRAAAELGLDPELPTVLVTGGSLGAVSVSSAVVGAAAELLAAGVQVLHLTGKGKAQAVRDQVRELSESGLAAGLAGRYQVREYLSRMQLALAVADLVVARAGAGTVSELAALGLPAVYVPLPIGNGEQRLNARPVVEAGGGVLVPDAELDPRWVVEQLLPLVADPSRLAEMGLAAAGVGVRDAAARVADLVEAAVPTQEATP